MAAMSPTPSAHQLKRLGTPHHSPGSPCEALSQLSKGDIVEVKAMGKPPGGRILTGEQAG